VGAKLPPRSGRCNTCNLCPIPKTKSKCKTCCTKPCSPVTIIDQAKRVQYSKGLADRPDLTDRAPPTGRNSNSRPGTSPKPRPFEAGAELRPEDPPLSSNWARPWRNPAIGRSAGSLESSPEDVPSQISARLLLGRVYLQLKDAKNAADQFEAGLLVDSSNSEGRLGLAEAQIQQSDFAGALPDLRGFTKTDPRNVPCVCSRDYRGLGKEQTHSN